MRCIFTIKWFNEEENLNSLAQKYLDHMICKLSEIPKLTSRKVDNFYEYFGKWQMSISIWYIGPELQCELLNMCI